MKVDEIYEEMERRIVSEEYENGESYSMAHLMNDLFRQWAQYITTLLDTGNAEGVEQSRRG